MTKGNFTRDEWNHLLTLFNISHFSSAVCSAAMAKRIQQESGEERVTAKSKPMMNLTAMTPSVVSSSTSLSPVKRYYRKQDPWKFVVANDRSGQLDKTFWSMEQQVRLHHGETLLDGTAQSMRYGELLRDRSGQLDNINSQEVADSTNFIMGNCAAELELSVESRSFVDRVNDQVRKRQKRMSNVAGAGEELSIIWRMFLAVTMNAATFMGKNFQDNQNFFMNSTDLTLQKMFDISAKLVGEQDETSNVDKIHWEKHSWRQLSLIGDETVINLQRTKVYVFSDSVLGLGKILQHPKSNEAWKDRIEWITTSESYRDYDGIN